MSRAPIAFAAVAALVALTVVAVRAVAADARGCSKGVTLSVAAAPDLAPVLREAATRWTATNPKVNGDCVKVQVTGAEPGSVQIGDRGEMVLRRVAERSGVPDYGYSFSPATEVKS